MGATRTPADWGTGRSSHGGFAVPVAARDCGASVNLPPWAVKRSDDELPTRAAGAHLHRTATTAEPCPNSPWLAVIPARAPGT